MEKSESIKNLAVALVAAQGELKVVEKGAENPFFKSKYADLPAIVKEYQRVFPKHGLSVVQIIEGMGLRTILMHISGEWLSCPPAVLNPVKNDPQGLGSAITYMRRYSLASVCGIVSSEDDDDGNHASAPKEVKHDAPRQAAAPAPHHDSAPTEKRVIGKIDSSEDGGNGFRKYSIKGVELTTKIINIITTMEAAMSNGIEVQVDYTEQPRGRFINRYISKATEVEPLPF